MNNRRVFAKKCGEHFISQCHSTEKLVRGPFCCLKFSGAAYLSGAKILVTVEGTSVRDVENFLSPRKKARGGPSMFLKVSGIEKLYTYERFFVSQIVRLTVLRSFV